MFGLAARRGEDWVPITSLPGASLTLWPQTTNDALDVVCTQCYAGESDLKNSCTECWVQKTKPGYLDLNQQLPMHKGTSLAMVWPQPLMHWILRTKDKARVSDKMKCVILYRADTLGGHISTYRPEWSDIVSKQWGVRQRWLIHRTITFRHCWSNTPTYL